MLAGEVAKTASSLSGAAPRLLVRLEQDATAGATATTRAAGAGDHARLHRQQAFALHLLAGELAGPADRLGLLARLFLGRLLVMTAQLHLAENALALHLLLERLESLIDVIVANENLHCCSCVGAGPNEWRNARQAGVRVARL